MKKKKILFKEFIKKFEKNKNFIDILKDEEGETIKQLRNNISFYSEIKGIENASKKSIYSINYHVFDRNLECKKEKEKIFLETIKNKDISHFWEDIGEKCEYASSYVER